MSKLFYSKEFASTSEGIAETLGEAIEALTRHKWCGPDHTFCVRLCLEEALVNAVVHGNKNQSHLSVRIEIFDLGNQCKICVHDEGEGFDLDAIEMADCSQLGGRGVCLIKEYMDEVQFDTTRNCLEMVFQRTTFSEICA